MSQELQRVAWESCFQGFWKLTHLQARWMVILTLSVFSDMKSSTLPPDFVKQNHNSWYLSTAMCQEARWVIVYQHLMESESLLTVSEVIGSLSLPVCPASCLAPTFSLLDPFFPLIYTHPMPQACTTSTWSMPFLASILFLSLKCFLHLSSIMNSYTSFKTQFLAFVLL